MPDVASFLKTHGQPVFSVNAEESLAETARRFGEKVGGRKYSLAVVCDDDDRPVGVITLGDIVYALATREAAASGLAVREAMTTNVIAAGPDDDIGDLLRTMAEKDIN